jgi:high-affinity nickel-transport protein
LGLGLVAANIAAWGWALATFGNNAVLLGTALLAYIFGLRHAVDADHIAAIDNATRKLVEAGRPAMTTGLYFSLGHATVVVLATLGIALGTARLPNGIAALRPFAGIIGTMVSAASLFVLAVSNTMILVAVCRHFAARRRGEEPGAQELARLLAQRGLLGRLLRSLFRLIEKSWHLYPLGFLFGLGFDTATEIGLLALTAAQAANGLSLVAIMVLPALFTAGMALVDSLDGMLMFGAYRWAAAEPTRKLYYNLTVTAFSVVVAVAIGGLELLGLIARDAPQTRGFWAAVTAVGDHFGAIGAAIIGLFALTWVISLLISRNRASAAGRA